MNPQHAWMGTFTGRSFFPLDPNPDDIVIEDIAHALANTCRYGGHVRTFYSVAEHAVLLSQFVRYDPRWALMHDATEAYMADLIRPLKHAVTGYREAEDYLMSVIAKKFDLTPGPMPAEVREADLRIVLDEKEALMAATPLPWSALEGYLPLGVRVEGWSPVRAKATFLRRFEELWS